MKLSQPVQRASQEREQSVNEDIISRRGKKLTCLGWILGKPVMKEMTLYRGRFRKIRANIVQQSLPN